MEVESRTPQKSNSEEERRGTEESETGSFSGLIIDHFWPTALAITLLLVTYNLVVQYLVGYYLCH